MEKNKFIAMAIMAMTFAACSNDGDTPNIPSNERIPISLSSNLQVLTRAFEPTQDDNTYNIVNGEFVYAWVQDCGSSPSGVGDYIHAWKLTANGSGAFTGTTMYYPPTGHKVSIWALHGNFKEDGTDANNGNAMTLTEACNATMASPWSTGVSFPHNAPIYHNVEADQNTGSNYALSDLMYAKTVDCARQAGAHALAFQHLLSKVEVYLYAGNGVTSANLEGATIKIKNTALKSQVTIDSATAVTVPTPSLVPVVSGTTNPATDISMKLHQTTSGDGYNTATISTDPTVSKECPVIGEAIVVPQTVAASSALIEVTLAAAAGGGTLVYKLTNAQTFEKGKKYTYYVQAGLTTLQVSSTINAWGDGSEADGTNVNASMD